MKRLIRWYLEEISPRSVKPGGKYYNVGYKILVSNI